MTGLPLPLATSWRAWVPEAALAAFVLVAGVLLATGGSPADDLVPMSLVALGTAAAVLLARHAPGAALGLVWATCTLQLVTGVPVSLVQVAVAVVAFGCGRWGSPATVVLSGLSIPTAAAVGVGTVVLGSLGLFRRIETVQLVLDGAYAMSDVLLVGAAIIGLAVLGVPWLAGLLLRATARAERSRLSQAVAEDETAQAQEIARLRDGQARLANDVHDVVGHSLAVILAQAESAQYLPDDDPARLKATLATIATSARSSLQDVRAVLGDTRAAPRADGLAELVEGVRSTGREVVVSDVGTPRPLPPELDVVAHRVVQEMLTNAVRHGRRDAPVHLERHWPDGGLGGIGRDLRLEVRNQTRVEAPAEVTPGVADETQPLRPASASEPGERGGQGLPGMQGRLDAVGGRLDVRRREDTFTATAWLPVSGR